MTKNQKYETKMKARGLKKITLWIPTESQVELKSIAEFCCDNKDYIPFMVRSLTTGKMRKGV
ncbi:hypothetical protein [Shewanella sp. YLB-07]|uniref:hypothetical protein n=1 Tax=Shewanella sp. YLB-07 TaxID=2601268 RepID=UPI00128AEE53|nr:hypothetical protein [Shewanella sp. YLB-07]MPY23912.1 hypothetical protein [Shewanella sp. YLB-07]